MGLVPANPPDLVLVVIVSDIVESVELIRKRKLDRISPMPIIEYQQSHGSDINFPKEIFFMMKFILVVALMVVGSSVYAGECSNGKCNLRSRVVNTTREIVAVPVEVTRRTVEVTRKLGCRTSCNCKTRTVVR